MYKFLMVDDEEIVRRGFRRKIDWDSLEFEFLEPCENGEQAIEAIETLHPDVVMTDIYMPRVDGLAVAEHAAQHHPDIVIVILSGYDEFEYAQKAIKSKVFEYVLKPVTSRDLTGLSGESQGSAGCRSQLAPGGERPEGAGHHRLQPPEDARPRGPRLGRSDTLSRTRPFGTFSGSRRQGLPARP